MHFPLVFSAMIKVVFFFYFCSAFCAFVCVELRENLSKLGQNLKQSLIDSAMKTWQSINDFALAHCYQTPGEADATVAESTEVKGNKRMRQNPFYKKAKLIGGMFIVRFSVSILRIFCLVLLKITIC